MGVSLFLLIIILSFGLSYIYTQRKYKEILKTEKTKNDKAAENYQKIAEETKRKLHEKSIHINIAGH